MANRNGGRARSGQGTAPPLSMLEQVRDLRPRIGDEDWFLRRREARPGERAPDVRDVVVLPLDRLRDAARHTLDGFVPEEAPQFPGGPRAVEQPAPRFRRRFNGSKVRLLNVTQIFDGESRQVFADTSFPWVSIGRVAFPDGSWGTGTLVGPRLILTAAHVLDGFWAPGRPLTQSLTFTPANFDGVSLLGRGWVANIVNVAVWDTSHDDQGYDMAVCQLDQPMGDWLGYFGARTYDDDWEDEHVFAHVGYPWDFSPSGQRPIFELGIAVEDDDSDDYDTLELETRADGGSGQSGGPLWGLWGDQHQVIGTLAGVEDNFGEAKNMCFAGGNGLVELIRWGRDNWP